MFNTLLASSDNFKSEFMKLKKEKSPVYENYKGYNKNNKKNDEIKKFSDFTKTKNIRTSNTILASTQTFKDQFKKLRPDLTTTKNNCLHHGPCQTGIAGIQMKVPDSFDGIKIWKDFIHPVRDQGSCGACWAFASTFVMASRLSIYTQGKYNFVFSAGDMILCNLGSEDEYKIAEKQLDVGQPYDYNLSSQREYVRNYERIGLDKYGCNGESLIGAWQYLYRFGVPEDNCAKYSGGLIPSLYNYNESDVLGTCSDLKTDTYDVCPDTKLPLITHLSTAYYYVPGSKTSLLKAGTELDIRRDIYKWGPCSTAIKVYEDFLSWNKTNKDDIYEWDGKSDYLGGHSVSIIGWGEQNGKKYWLIRNSWGEDWGYKGYGKFLRGSNHCEIEDNVFTGFPNLYGFRLYVEWPLLYRPEDFALRAIWRIKGSGYKETTYEKLITGKINYVPEMFEYQPIDQFLYEKEYWPDVSQMLAGDKSTFIFRLGNKNKARSIKNIAEEIKDNKKLIYIIFGVLTLILIIIIIYKLYKRKSLNTKYNY